MKKENSDFLLKFSKIGKSTTRDTAGNEGFCRHYVPA